MIRYLSNLVGIFILNKYLNVRNRSLTIRMKFVISMVFAFVTMCLSGGIENYRQDYCPISKLFKFIFLII